MTIYCCTCGYAATKPRSIGRHITQAPNHPTIKEYYDLHHKQADEGICDVCGDPTTFKDLTTGYKKKCSRTCAAKRYRERLRNDQDKYDKFRKKVTVNQAKIWKERDPEVTKAIAQKSGETNRKINSLLTPEERIKKYSYWERCSPEKAREIADKCTKHLLSLYKNGWKCCMKGKFKPQHPEKYVGDVKNIIYRSSWEFKAMKDLDSSPSVEAWSSEGMAIDYWDPSKKNPETMKLGKWRRYFPDFIVKKRGKDGKVETIVIEIKPAHEMAPPITHGKTKKKLLKESATYATNLSKWKACKEFCQKYKWRFMVLNEYDLGLKKR